MRTALRAITLALTLALTTLATSANPAEAGETSGLQDPSQTWGGNYTSTNGENCSAYFNTWIGKTRFPEGTYTVNTEVNFWANPDVATVPAGQQYSPAFYINPGLSTARSNAANYTAIAPAIYTTGFTNNSGGALRWSARVPDIDTQTNADYVIKDITWYITENTGQVTAWKMRDNGGPGGVSQTADHQSTLNQAFNSADKIAPISAASGLNASTGPGSTTTNHTLTTHTRTDGKIWTRHPNQVLSKNSYEYHCAQDFVSSVGSGVGYCQNSAAHPLSACNSRRASLLGWAPATSVDWWLEPIPGSTGSIGMPWTNNSSFPPLQPKASWQPRIDAETTVHWKVNSGAWANSTSAHDTWTGDTASTPTGATGYWSDRLPVTLTDQGPNVVQTIVGDQTTYAPTGYSNRVHNPTDEIIHYDSVAPTITGAQVTNPSATQFQISATSILDAGYPNTGVGAGTVQYYWRPVGSTAWISAGTQTLTGAGGAAAKQITGSFAQGTSYQVRMVAYDKVGNNRDAILQFEYPYANHPPVAVDDVGSMAIEDGNIVVDVLANDSDLDDSHASFQIRQDYGLAPSTLGVTVQPPASEGSVVLNGGQLQFFPASGFVGTSTFEYQVCDAKAACDQAVVTITVSGSPPNAQDDIVTSERVNLPLLLDLLDNDTAGSGTLVPGSVTISGVPSQLVITNLADGTIIINVTGADNGVSQTYEFQYEVCNSVGLCDTADVVVTLDPLLPT